MKTLLFAVLSTLAVATSAQAEKIVYGAGEQKFEGIYLKSPKANSPGILLIHNWMGVTDETLTQAKRFNALGYNVLAADIYGQGIRPTDPKSAGELATKYKTDRKLFRERLELGLDTLKKQKGVNTQKLAVLGYCFGGTGAIELARTGAPVVAAISFHGGLDSPTPADGAKIKGKILALHGGNDPYVPVADVQAFEKEMLDNKVSYELVKYGNTVHSFTDKGAGTDMTKGAAYNPLSDKRSFARATELLREVF